MKRSFKDLSAAEVLALAISLEEEDARLFEEFARRVRPNDPKAATALAGGIMAVTGRCKVNRNANATWSMWSNGSYHALFQRPFS